LTCFLFSSKLDGHPGSDVFIKQGLDNEKWLMQEKDVHFSTTLEIVLAHRITMQ